MSITQSSLWGIVLAGGEGVRLKEFVQERIGTDRPKQFCAFVGTRTMLERTVRRARFLIPPHRLIVSGTAHHRRLLFQSLGNKPPGSILLQPQNRDTAAGILFPLIHILKAAPHAHVAILPSGHFVLPGRRLMQEVSHAADFLHRTKSDSPIILAAEATYPETEYGWIAPGGPVTADKPGSIFHVEHFAEKPSSREAELMLSEKWCWNTMVLVARGAALLECFRSALPDIVACFELVQRYLGSHVEQTVTDEVYRMIPSLNFSTTVLAQQPDRLLVLPTRQIRWSDWGNKERILQSLATLRYAERASLVPAMDLGIPA